MSDEQIPDIKRVETTCVICHEPCYGAAGRGYCPECMITFPLPRPSRKQVLSVFAERYYIAKGSPFYHRPGCKYLKNILPENLVVVTEPTGKPCRCSR